MASKKEIKDQSARSIEQLEDDIRTLSDTLEQFISSSADDSAEQLDQLRNEAGSRLAEVKERFQQHGNNIRDRLKSGQETLQEHGRDAFQCADSYVQDNPWRGIGIAAAAGLAIGILIGRR